METAVQEPVLSEQVIVDRSPELRRARAKGPRAPKWRLSELGLNFILRVTREVIDSSERGDGATCALARAWLAERPDDQPHFEGESPHVILATGETVFVPLAPDLVEWVGKFDRGEPVEPMELQIGY